MAVILLMAFLNAFSWNKILYFDLDFTKGPKGPIDSKSALVQLMS